MFKEVLRAIAPIFRVRISFGVRFIDVVCRNGGIFSVLFQYFLWLADAVFRQAFARRVGGAASHDVGPVR